MKLVPEVATEEMIKAGEAAIGCTCPPYQAVYKSPDCPACTLVYTDEVYAAMVKAAPSPWRKVGVGTNPKEEGDYLTLARRPSINKHLYPIVKRFYRIGVFSGEEKFTWMGDYQHPTKPLWWQPIIGLKEGE